MSDKTDTGTERVALAERLYEGAGLTIIAGGFIEAGNAHRKETT